MHNNYTALIADEIFKKYQAILASKISIGQHVNII